MSKEKYVIQSISEAFSQQPVTLRVVRTPAKNSDIARIVVEKHVIDGTQKSFYVGYNKEDRKLFFYHVSSCNVHYEPEEDELPF